MLFGKKQQDYQYSCDKIYTKYGKITTMVDDLRSCRCFESSFSTPVHGIVVTGENNSGKTSVINYLTGYNFLPFGTRTLRTLEIRFQHTADNVSPSIKIEGESKNFTNMDEAKKYIANLLNDTNDSNIYEPIRLTLTTNSSEDMLIIDCQFEDNNNNSTLESKKRYLSDSSNLILLVLSAKIFMEENISIRDKWFNLIRNYDKLDDKNITKLIFLVSGRPEDEFKLDQNDTFNYIEFCDLFEQKAKNHLLRRRKMNNAKNSINIDWKFNQLSIIISGIEKCNITIEEAFNGSDRTYKGFITFEEFEKVLNSCEVNINFNDSKRLYDMFDHSKKNLIPLENLISELKITEKEIEKYNIMTNNVLSETQQKIDYAKKFTLINEEKQYFNIRMNQMQKRLEELERNNADLTKNLEEYANKNTDFVNKYFSTLDELQQYKETYMN